jgi:hypothetical protein
MEEKESDRSENTAIRFKLLGEHNKYLQEELRRVQLECDRRGEEAARWKSIAEEERKSWIQVHDAMNLIRQDVIDVLDGDTYSVHRKLEAEREQNQQLLARRQQWRDHARRSTEAKAEAAQKVRDLEEVVEQLRQKVTDAEAQRDAVAELANAAAEQNAQREERFKGWCERWLRGEVAGLETLAAFAAELTGHTAPEPSYLERRRAVDVARNLSLLNEATDQLKAIETLLQDAGVPLMDTHAHQVGDYIAMMNSRLDSAKEVGNV